MKCSSTPLDMSFADGYQWERIAKDLISLNFLFSVKDFKNVGLFTVSISDFGLSSFTSQSSTS
ncbi:hypothetical protein I4U23_005423 [Adineta vaga]|nr:hypothetical protein I4U23_005423 [Adineta vaga]